MTDQPALILDCPQTAHARIALGRFGAEAELVMTPAGLLAVGGLVVAILLAVPPIIRAAKGRPAQPDRGRLPRRS
ncbi:hypothetical protein [uncultured Sphingomonas sp.]|uniref:hypothetical protein n=1 Tax=uncultured Sphingomonas sp. TaxID=158754 RepID=UPI0025E8D1AC|nr:hypothetical protein [uncultured Sphingomonas sp.]